MYGLFTEKDKQFIKVSDQVYSSIEEADANKKPGQEAKALIQVSVANCTDGLLNADTYIAGLDKSLLVARDGDYVLAYAVSAEVKVNYTQKQYKK
jgi:hypothetical protein